VAKLGNKRFSNSQSFGDFLRKAREARKLSRESVFESTKVSVSNIKALEDEDFESLPADVYVRGFLKSLARHLELQSEDVIARYRKVRPSQDVEFASPEGNSVEDENRVKKESMTESVSPFGANLAQRVNSETAVKAWMVAAQRKINERSKNSTDKKEPGRNSMRPAGRSESLAGGGSKRLNLGLVLLLLIIAVVLTLSYMLNRSPSSQEQSESPAASESFNQYEWKG